MDNLQAVIDAVRDGQAPSPMHVTDTVLIAYTPRGRDGHGEVHTIDL